MLGFISHTTAAAAAVAITAAGAVIEQHSSHAGGVTVINQTSGTALGWFLGLLLLGIALIMTFPRGRP